MTQKGFQIVAQTSFFIDGWKKRYRDRVSGIDSFEVSGIDVGTGCWRQNVLMTTLRC